MVNNFNIKLLQTNNLEIILKILMYPFQRDVENQTATSGELDWAEVERIMNLLNSKPTPQVGKCC